MKPAFTCSGVTILHSVYHELVTSSMPIFGGFASAAMTNLDAAYEVLKQAGQPLRCEQITEQALGQRLIAPRELRPMRRYLEPIPTS